MTRTSERVLSRLGNLTFLVALTTAPTVAQDPAAAGSPALQAGGLATPLQIYPVRVLGRPHPNVGEALGLVLEQQGMADLGMNAAFAHDGKGTWSEIVTAFALQAGKDCQGAPPRWSLYAEFLGDPRTGPEEVRFCVVDATGKVALVDRQTPQDKAFRRTAGRDPDPLGCAHLVQQRLFELAGWRAAPGSVQEGKFAAQWRSKSGVPDKQELAAMQGRNQELRAQIATARLEVLPTLWQGTHEVGSSERFAKALADRYACQAVAGAAGTRLQVAVSANEQQRLWDLARALQASARAQASTADYVLALDIGLDPEKGAGFVHIAVCTRRGDFVLAEFLNDQHGLFASRRPKTLADAEQVALLRLRELWH